MSEPVPPAGGRGGMGRNLGGLPLWGWGIIGLAAVGTIIYLRIRSGSSSSSAAAGSNAAPADQQIGLTQYEQISSQLTGIEGTDEALLAAVKDLQGDEGEPPRRHQCPEGRHWDADEKRCVKDGRDRDDTAAAGGSSGSSSGGSSSGGSSGSAAAAARSDTTPAPARDPGPVTRMRRRPPARRRRPPEPRRRAPVRRAA